MDTHEERETHAGAEPQGELTELDGVAAAPGQDNRSPTPPEAPVRGAAAFELVERLMSRADSFLARYLPPELNPLAQAGRVCNFAILNAVLSGVMLLIWYSPSLPQAYSSVAATQAGTLGGWVRAFHRYSSDFVMMFALLHAGRMFVARKFVGSRWVPWVSGIGLLALIWFIGWTGYWLVWDQPAQQVAVTSMRLMDAVPIFGEPMGRLYVADRMVPSLLFFVVFFLHMLLPLAIAVGLAVHLLRVSRIRLLPDRRLGLAVALGLAAAAFFVRAPLDDPARMALKAPSFSVDAWYLSPLAVTLRFQHAGPWLALGGALVGAMALPWLLGRRRLPAAYQTEVDVNRCHGCTQCVQDCPFDAVHMVDRSDGKRFATQAFVDPDKCVGCGVCVGSCDSEAMSLGWFDTRREEARIQAETTRDLRVRPWVAFVAGDIDSGFGLYRLALWRERLADYQVHVVPTASWVRPKFVERLLAMGVKGVLIVRDAKAEAAARDGNHWVHARLSRERKPHFRPERAAGSTAWKVLDFDASRPAEFARRARAFAKADDDSESGRATPLWRRVTVGAILAAAVVAAAVFPSRLRISNPAPAAPEFVFSFKALGDRQAAGAVSAADDASVPVHMRGRSLEKPHRQPVVVKITLDGKTSERAYAAKGISRDGPALGQWRETLTEGSHDVRVELFTSATKPAVVWEGTINATDRHISVLTYDPQSGFRLE